MRIAIASGKGGTGKTTIAVNLAALLARNGEQDITYADCDVEEPNGHIFLSPWIDASEPVTIPVPVIDEDRCTVCGECGSFCQYKAIATLPGQVMIFEELCHGCGGCSLVCAQEAISERPREVGTVEQGVVVMPACQNTIKFVHGRLRIKEPQSVPVIKAVKSRLTGRGISILDAPPGSSCPMVEAVRGSDLVLLVTEPTPFGLHDLEIAVQTVRELGLRSAVVLNRCDIGDDRVERYCERMGVDVIARIPNSREIAEAYSRGALLLDEVDTFAAHLLDMLPRMLELAAEGQDQVFERDEEQDRGVHKE